MHEGHRNKWHSQCKGKCQVGLGVLTEEGKDNRGKGGKGGKEEYTRRIKARAGQTTEKVSKGYLERKATKQVEMRKRKRRE